MISPLLRTHPIHNLFTRAHAVPLLGYAALLTGLVATAWLALASLAGVYADYTTAADLLARLEGRRPSVQSSDLAAGPGPSGSPFLEGATANVAGAALQQRVVAAVTEVGGSVLSSQIDLEGAQSKQGYVNLSARCEVDQPVLQQLLYDLEAGMPFLFIDQLVVQAPQSHGETGSGSGIARMRVQIDVSGQWQVTK
jgi:general secretion pathway protein M